MGASTSHKPKGLHGLYRDNFTFTIYLACNGFWNVYPQLLIKLRILGNIPPLYRMSSGYGD
jgi:hypothetical protein